MSTSPIYPTDHESLPAGVREQDIEDARRLSAGSANQFNRFQEGCVEAYTNTAALVRRLLSDAKSDKVIVTTIQKLDLARLSKHPRRKRLVLEGDKCLIRNSYSRNSCVATN